MRVDSASVSAGIAADLAQVTDLFPVSRERRGICRLRLRYQRRPTTSPASLSLEYAVTLSPAQGTEVGHHSTIPEEGVGDDIPGEIGSSGITWPRLFG